MNANAVVITREVRDYLDRKEAKPFGETHPFTVTVDSGPPLRFSTLKCAARTAVDRRTGIWDEDAGRGYDAAECIRIASAAGEWPYAR